MIDCFDCLRFLKSIRCDANPSVPGGSAGMATAAEELGAPPGQKCTHPRGRSVRPRLPHARGFPRGARCFDGHHRDPSRRPLPAAAGGGGDCGGSGGGVRSCQWVGRIHTCDERRFRKQRLSGGWESSEEAWRSERS